MKNKNKFNNENSTNFKNDYNLNSKNDELFDDSEEVEIFNKKYCDTWAESLLAEEKKWIEKKEMLDDFIKDTNKQYSIREDGAVISHYRFNYWSSENKNYKNTTEKVSTILVGKSVHND